MKLRVVVLRVVALILLMESIFISNLSPSVHVQAAQKFSPKSKAKDPRTGHTQKTRVQSRVPSSQPSPVAFDSTLFSIFNSMNLSDPTCWKRITQLSIRPSPEAYLTTAQIIRKHGYPVELHTVTTKDGYILTMHRIRHGRINTKTAENFPRKAGNTKPVVLMQHGMSASSSEWLMQKGDDSLPFMLANAGYDVWITNERGVKYSNKHKKYSSSSRKYWQFTMDEMALIDNPLRIDYILNKTKEPQLYFIGHSMGGTLFFMTMATFPEYNSKIRSFYGFGPAAYLGDMTTPFVKLAPLAPLLGSWYKLIGFGEFMPPHLLPFSHKFGPIICAPSYVALTLCGFFVYTFLGFDPCQFQTNEQISKIMGHAPNPISYLTVMQYIQFYHTKKFQHFDWGPEENKKRYGRRTPPSYDLSKVTAPVASFWGDNDIIVRPTDINRTLNELPNVIASYRVDWPLWTHGDFIFAIDARRLVYEPMLKIMAKNY